MDEENKDGDENDGEDGNDDDSPVLVAQVIGYYPDSNLTIAQAPQYGQVVATVVDFSTFDDGAPSGMMAMERN